MALADIIRRIESDTRIEAEAIVAEAHAESERVRSNAEHEAARRKERELERLSAQAAEEAHTRLAAARLRGRDRIIAEKRVLLGRALIEATKRVVAMPDERYAAFLARQVAQVVRGGEVLEIGHGDAERLATVLPAALADAGVDVHIAGSADSLEHGLLVKGQRMNVEVSVAAMVTARRNELEAAAATRMFAEEDTES